MIETFKNFLSAKGIIPTCSENLLQFTYKKLNFALLTQASDPFYFTLILPNIYTITLENEQQTRTIMAELTATYKVAKFFAVNESVWLSAEQFVYSRENINALYDRLLSVLQDAYTEFNNKMRES